MCYKEPWYGPHESEISLKEVKILLAEDLIERCATGGWGSTIVFAPKPHQERVNMVKDLIWRSGVSY